ncbi:MAG: hypothetical protein AAFP19_11535 [Bacteroidota bacterium]
MNTNLSLADKLTNETYIENAINSRNTTTKKLRTISLQPGLINGNGLFNQGTIITLVSQGNKEYLKGLVDAIEDNNKDKIQLYSDAILKRAQRDTSQPPSLGGLDDIPVIVNVRYGDVWLAKNLLLAPYTNLALSITVWSGGDLNEAAFSVEEHWDKHSKATDLYVLSILVPPEKTEIEKAVLKAVPDNLSEVHVNGPSVSWSAAGLNRTWTPVDKTAKPGLKLFDISELFVPLYGKQQQITTVHQHQQQQKNTKQQQQQQQNLQQQQRIQQQQQQQQQDDGAVQQQQQQQVQNEKTIQDQVQEQAQQQADGKQENQQHRDIHQENTGRESSLFGLKDDLDGGFSIRPIEQDQYVQLLDRIDFQSMDATQSVKELLRLRERLINFGLS